MVKQNKCIVISNMYFKLKIQLNFLFSLSNNIFKLCFSHITYNDNNCEPNVSMKFTQITKEAACFNLNLNDIPIL